MSPSSTANGSVADVVPGGTDGVAQPVQLLLPDEVDVRQVGDAADGSRSSSSSRDSQLRLQLEVAVEVLLDRALALADDHEDVRDAGGHRLLDHVLDHRRVDDRQHLLGLRLGGGQEARAESGGGDDGFLHHGSGFSFTR